ncbi:MAG: hypothetical protein M3015_11605 [Bacteroidota bacterium]|nr:hypothetical protein [Bacteroidota bacterium]
MKNKSHEATVLGAIGAAIGKGMIAGVAGTLAMTVSQMIEMRITKRKPSNAPAKAVKKALHIEAEEGNKEDFSNEVHWVYGTFWGVARGLFSLVGLTGFAATVTHMTALWGTAIIIEPQLGIAPPVTEWEPKDIAIDIFHHAVYAIVAGLVYDAID